MPLVRRRLSWMIRIWLLCQITGLAAAPYSLCCGRFASADQTPECCRGVGPGQTCPMHHGGDSDTTCKMRSACGSADAALLTLTGGLGVLPESTIAVNPFDPGVVLHVLTVSSVRRAESPDPPPPRP